MPNFSSPQVVCRPALPMDAADVLEFTKFIWDGHDYIKYVWHDWLADPQGILAVAEYAGHAVGLGKLTCISPGHWWLEGLRVDPKFQGLKISSHIFRYLDDWWQEHGGGAVRLMTSSERLQVHHLCGRLGYDKLGEVRAWRAAPLQQGGGNASVFQPVGVDELPQARKLIAARLQPYGGLMDSGWQFSEPDEPGLRQKIQAGRLWWWGAEHNGLLAAWEDLDDDERTLGIGFAAVNRESLGAMLQDVLKLAHGLGYTRVLWMAPVLPWVESSLQAAGYQTEWDGSAYLFGKRPPGRPVKSCWLSTAQY